MSCASPQGHSLKIAPSVARLSLLSNRLTAKSFGTLKRLSDVLGFQPCLDAEQRVLAIETESGELFPLIEDLRTRAFRTDDRLRQMSVQLTVRRYNSTPSLQVLKTFERRAGQRFEVDYWCDVCSIVMIEAGPCACCQDNNRLRKRLVDDKAR